jgi:hypothetical protein
MLEVSDQLQADIEATYQEFCTRSAALLSSPGATGYSAEVLTGFVAMCVDYESHLAALGSLAQTFDAGKPSTASQRLAVLNGELRKKLKEASFMAAFKVVYEDFAAYVNALPTAFPANASLIDLTLGLQRLEDFQKRFRSFEPRAAELAGEGLMPTVQEKWLSPLAEICQAHISAMQKRCDELRRPMDLNWLGSIKNIPPQYLKKAPDPNIFDYTGYKDDPPPKKITANTATSPAQTVVPSPMDQFNAIYNEMNTATKQVESQIDASARNIWFDRTPLYNAVIGHYEKFLARIAELEPSAKRLEDQGQPQLAQTIKAHKADVEKAMGIVRQMIASRQASTMAGFLKTTADLQTAWQKHHETMYGLQQQITNSINSYKP